MPSFREEASAPINIPESVNPRRVSSGIPQPPSPPLSFSAGETVAAAGGGGSPSPTSPRVSFASAWMTADSPVEFPDPRLRSSGSGFSQTHLSIGSLDSLATDFEVESGANSPGFPGTRQQSTVLSVGSLDHTTVLSPQVDSGLLCQLSEPVCPTCMQVEAMFWSAPPVMTLNVLN